MLVSGGFCLFGCMAAFAFFTRKSHRGAHTTTDEFHQAGHNPFVGVDPRAGQHFATIARASPTGNLFRTVAILLVISDGIIQRGQYNSRKKFTSTIALFIVKGSAVNEILHLVFLVFIALVYFGAEPLMTDQIRFGYPSFA